MKQSLKSFLFFVFSMLVLTSASQAQTQTQVVDVSNGKTMTIIKDTRVTYGSGSKLGY